MDRKNQNQRRNFLKSTCGALALSTIPGSFAIAQSVRLRTRIEWSAFKRTPSYLDFVRAITMMRANTDANDRRSWAYWVNVHLNYCPHGIEYFLAWHRGYLYYFEEYLRMVSGNPALTLPYWDYYQNPVIPAEFTNAAANNPLYVDRTNTDVSAALTQAPFSATLTNFERGTPNSYEVSLESKPHDPVHDIIGSIMATMHSPEDPIFWLHHANIDRLWNAWVAAGKGRQMPANNSLYWKGKFTYGLGLTMDRSLTINSRTKLGYAYDNETFPTLAPSLFLAAATGTSAARAPLASTQRTLIRPDIGAFEQSAARPTDANRFSLGGSRAVVLDERSVSARVPLSQIQIQQIRDALTFEGKPRSNNGLASGTPNFEVVLDDVHLSDAGLKGGYFYLIYLNLPVKIDMGTAEVNYLVGNVGPFAIAGALHHVEKHRGHARGSRGVQSGSARLAFPITKLLANQLAGEMNGLTVSFVRVSGDTTPQGIAISVGEMLVEVVTESGK